MQKATMYDWAFGQLKQADIFTAIAAASLNKRLPYRAFSPVILGRELRSDVGVFGKGHDFATYSEIVSDQYSFGREFDATNQSLAWALSLLMGGVYLSGSTPPIYTHEITFIDPATQKECLYTSIIEKAGSEYQNLLSGVFLESVTLSGSGTEMVKVALTARARKQVTNATGLPGVTLSTFFQSTFASWSFGPRTAPLPVSDQLINWSITLSQNPEVRFAPGASSGDERLIRYALIGMQQVTGSITMFLDNTRRNLFINGDECALTIVLTGISNFAHKCTIAIPIFKIASEAIVQEGNTTAYTFALNEQTVLKSASVAGSPIKITLVNDIPALIA